jgi:hypothetical protein
MGGGDQVAVLSTWLASSPVQAWSPRLVLPIWPSLLQPPLFSAISFSPQLFVPESGMTPCLSQDMFYLAIPCGWPLEDREKVPPMAPEEDVGLHKK